jgi:putative ABC transport system permease protein
VKYVPLIWAGLWRKPLRTLLTSLAVMMAFLLLGAIGSIDAGFRHVRGTSRMDRLFVDPKFGGMFTGSANLPITYMDQVEKLAGVTKVAPNSSLFGFYQNQKNPLGIAGTDERFFKVRPELNATPEQIRTWQATANGLMVTVGIAKRYGWKVGDRIPVQGSVARKDGDKFWNFEITAIIEDTSQAPGMSTYAIMNYAFIDESRVTDKGTLSRILFLVADPDDAGRIGKSIDALFANSTVPTRTQTEHASTESNLQLLGDLNFFVDAVAGAVLFMMLFLTANTMTQSVRERVTEFAVLRTIGFSIGSVTAMIGGEALGQCLPAAVAGLALGMLAVDRFRPANLPQATHTPWAMIATALAAAIVIAVLSSLLPIWRLRRKPIVDALADR